MEKPTPTTTLKAGTDQLSSTKAAKENNKKQMQENVNSAFSNRSNRSSEKQKNVYLTAVSGVNFGAQSGIVPSQLIMMRDNRQKDRARKGDTKSMNKAIPITSTDESLSNIDRSVSPKNGEFESDGVVILAPSSMKNRYESAPSATSDTEQAKASQKLYKTDVGIMAEEPRTNQPNST